MLKKVVSIFVNISKALLTCNPVLLHLAVIAQQCANNAILTEISRRNSDAICMFFGKTRNNFTFVTDFLLRFFQKKHANREHKCHLKNVRSQISQCSVKKRTMHAQRVCPIFLCDFLLQLCCK